MGCMLQLQYEWVNFESILETMYTTKVPLKCPYILETKKTKTTAKSSIQKKIFALNFSAQESIALVLPLAKDPLIYKTKLIYVT